MIIGVRKGRQSVMLKILQKNDNYEIKQILSMFRQKCHNLTTPFECPKVS